MRRQRTPYGLIYLPDGRCKDDYPNIVTAHWLGQVVTLQAPAMRALHAAEAEYAKQTHKTTEGKETGKGKGKPGRRQIALTGSLRTCDLQRKLWRSDPRRFANPDTSLHPRGLAVDVSMAQANLPVIFRIMASIGWRRARPTDEPWHHSWGVTA